MGVSIQSPTVSIQTDSQSLTLTERISIQVKERLGSNSADSVACS